MGATPPVCQELPGWAGQSGEIALMAEPVWQFRLSVGNEPLFSVPVRPQGCQTFPNAHPWVSHPIALDAQDCGIAAGLLLVGFSRNIFLDNCNPAHHRV